MPYTVWSRGRLIGQSALGYTQAAPGMRAGDFAPSPLGEKLMSIITGVGPAIKTLYRVAHDARTTPGQADGDSAPGFSAAVRQTTEYADAASLVDELESLALELRGPDGVVIPTALLAVNDTDYLLALASEPAPRDDVELSPELEEAIAHDIEEVVAIEREMRGTWDVDDDEEEGEDWKHRPPIARYQLVVVLEGGIMGTA